MLLPANLGIYKSLTFPTDLESADPQVPEQRKKYSSSLSACGTNKFESVSICCNQEVWDKKLAHSLWGTEKPSEIIFQAAEFHTLCLTPASNSNCHNLLLLHQATLSALPWRTDVEEQKGWRICENTFPSTIPKITEIEKRKNVSAYTHEEKQAAVGGNTVMVTHIKEHTGCYIYSTVISEAQNSIPSYTNKAVFLFKMPTHLWRVSLPEPSKKAQ